MTILGDVVEPTGEVWRAEQGSLHVGEGEG